MSADVEGNMNSGAHVVHEDRDANIRFVAFSALVDLFYRSGAGIPSVEPLVALPMPFITNPSTAGPLPYPSTFSSGPCELLIDFFVEGLGPQYPLARVLEDLTPPPLLLDDGPDHPVASNNPIDSSDATKQPTLSRKLGRHCRVLLVPDAALLFRAREPCLGIPANEHLILPSVS